MNRITITLSDDAMKRLQELQGQLSAQYGGGKVTPGFAISFALSNTDLRSKFMSPLLLGNEHLVRDVLLCLPNQEGSPQEVTDYCSKFRSPRVEKALEGLQNKGIVKFDEDAGTYSLI